MRQLGQESDRRRQWVGGDERGTRDDLLRWGRRMDRHWSNSTKPFSARLPRKPRTSASIRPRSAEKAAARLSTMAARLDWPSIRVKISTATASGWRMRSGTRSTQPSRASSRCNLTPRGRRGTAVSGTPALNDLSPGRAIGGTAERSSGASKSSHQAEAAATDGYIDARRPLYL